MTRLIDADKLGETIEGITWYHINSKGKLCVGANEKFNKPLYKAEDIFRAIDNAPTVENITIFKGCDNCEFERPQGEWDYEQIAFYGVCSNCGAAVTSNLADIFLYEGIGKCPYNTNFCLNCGAEMR